MALFLAIAAAALLFAAGSLAGWRWHLRRRRQKMDEQVDEARETLLEMQALIAQPGWTKLAASAQKHIEARRNKVLLEPTADIAEDNYMKGEIQGISIFVEIPRQLIEMNKDILATAKKLDEEGA